MAHILLHLAPFQGSVGAIRTQVGKGELKLTLLLQCDYWLKYYKQVSWMRKVQYSI
jgi:hypothetical protein